MLYDRLSMGVILSQGESFARGVIRAYDTCQQLKCKVKSWYLEPRLRTSQSVVNGQAAVFTK